MSLLASFASYGSSLALTVAGLCLLAVTTRGYLQASMEKKQSRKRKRRSKGKATNDPTASLASPDQLIDPTNPQSSPATLSSHTSPRPYAERRLRAKQGKEPAQVRDMLDTEVVQSPSYARVARVGEGRKAVLQVSKPSTTKATKAQEEAPSTAPSGYSSFEHIGSDGEGEDVEDTAPWEEPVEEQWEEVPSKPRSVSLSRPCRVPSSKPTDCHPRSFFSFIFSFGSICEPADSPWPTATLKKGASECSQKRAGQGRQAAG